MDSEHHYYNRRKEDTRERILEPHVVTIHKTETGFGFNVRGQVGNKEFCISRARGKQFFPCRRLVKEAT